VEGAEEVVAASVEGETTGGGNGGDGDGGESANEAGWR